MYSESEFQFVMFLRFFLYMFQDDLLLPGSGTCYAIVTNSTIR